MSAIQIFVTDKIEWSFEYQQSLTKKFIYASDKHENDKNMGVSLKRYIVCNLDAGWIELEDVKSPENIEVSVFR